MLYYFLLNLELFKCNKLQFGIKVWQEKENYIGYVKLCLQQGLQQRSRSASFPISEWVKVVPSKHRLPCSFPVKGFQKSSNGI